MTTPVLHFTPRAELQPLQNLEAFIAICRDSDILNARAQFDRNTWDVGHFKGQNKTHRAVFSTLEASALNKSEPSLETPFIDFAKAVLVYMQDERPVTSQAPRIAALRCMEAALRSLNKGSRPTAVNEDVLDQAVKLAQDQVSAGVAYRIAGQLEYLADLMRKKGFISLRRNWTHGAKKPQEVGSRITPEALKRRKEKLPSAAALRALGNIFYEAVLPTDIVVSSYTALMLCAPERINEVLRLSRNCVVTGGGEFKGHVGLRWAGSKGFENTTKWLPTEMASVGLEAIENLKTATASAQALATWYTDNPGKLYLHRTDEHLRHKEVLTLRELAQVLWGDSSATGQASVWAKTTKKLQHVQLSGRAIGYRFEDVEKAVIEMLPATFPYVPGAPDLLCKDALCLIRVNELHAGRATYRCMFTCIDYTTITKHIDGGEDRDSIFVRFDCKEDDGTPIRLPSHSLRHYLNMLAQMGGLTSAEIALFSGRKDVKQNRAYDHMTSDEVQAPISQAIKQGLTSEIVALDSARGDLKLRSEFNDLGLTAAHTTEYGWCRHDFASAPCEMYRDCTNCEEHECIKGDEHKEANLRRLKGETEHLLSEAQKALSDDEYNADIWVSHQKERLSRIDMLLSILEDPGVPKGARIRLDIDNAPLITNGDERVITFVRQDKTKALK